MKYLKLFESYNKFNDVKGEIEDIEFILQDLKDNGWIVNVDLVVKRWENPAANFHIKSDYIKIYIKKTDCKSGSRYPLDAEFNFNIIEDEIRHILSIHKDNEIDIKICLNDTDWEKSLDKQHIPRRNYLRGNWTKIDTNIFLEDKLFCSPRFSGYSYDTEILGIELNIYLNTNNIDQSKNSELNEENSFNIDEDSEHLKDLALDLTDEGDWSVNVYTNTEKYNEDEYSCKVILEPLDEFDWDDDRRGPSSSGGKINDTLIQYLENIIRYMEDYEYKIILTEDGNDLAPDQYEDQEIILNSIEEFKNWVKKELKHQQSDIMTYGFKGDLIIIEFYEK